MSYLESYIIDRINTYKVQLHNVNKALEKCYSVKQYDKLQFQRKTYTILLQELDMILALIKEEL